MSGMPKWEGVSSFAEDAPVFRLEVPGGWLYRIYGGPMAFVPKPAEEHKRKPVVREDGKPTYVQRAINGFEMRFGKGSHQHKYGEFGKWLKPLVQAHGEDKVIRALARYLDPAINKADASFVRISLFCQSFNNWVKGSPGQQESRPYDAPESDFTGRGIKEGAV